MKPKTVSEHYGISESSFEKMREDISFDMQHSNTKDEILDKHFPDCTLKERVKIHAYAAAMTFRFTDGIIKESLKWRFEPISYWIGALITITIQILLKAWGL